MAEWKVVDPYGEISFFPSRSLARAFTREHGGARAGFRFNEYEERKFSAWDNVRSYIDNRLYEDDVPRVSNRDMLNNLRTNMGLAYFRAERAQDIETMRILKHGYRLAFQYAQGEIDARTFDLRMKRVYSQMLDRPAPTSDTLGAYVQGAHTGTGNDWLYSPAESDVDDDYYEPEDYEDFEFELDEESGEE